MNKNVNDLENADFEISKCFVKPYIMTENKTKCEKLLIGLFQMIEKSIYFNRQISLNPNQEKKGEKNSVPVFPF